MSESMNVAIAVKEFPPDTIGGAETQTKRMAAALAERGHDVTVYTKRYGEHDDGDLPFEVVRCWNLDWTPVVSDLTFLLAATVAIARRADRHDCLQCMMIYPIGFLGYVVHRLAGLPYFAWIRGNDFYVAREVRWKRWLIRRVLSDALVLVQSTEIRADVVAAFPDLEPDVRVLGNGVSVPEGRAPLDGSRVLYLGRLAPKKGLPYLLEAVAESEVPDLELVVVGDGAERERLERAAAELDVDVRFEGFVHPDDVDDYYRRASVFVLPSTEGEGMPNAVLEAMSWGLPVVTTDSGGLPSVVRDGENGYVVPMRDPEPLAERIEDLVADRDRRQELGTAAREHVRERHSWDRIVAELEDVYEHVASR